MLILEAEARGRRDELPMRICLLFFVVVHLLALDVVASDSSAVRAPRPRPVRIDSEHDEAVLENYIWNTNLGEKEVIVFQSSFGAGQEDDPPGRDSSGNRFRSRTGESKESIPIPSGIMKESERRDPNHLLFRRHGFRYVGTLSSHLPDFHIIERNVSRETSFPEEGDYRDHLRNVYDAVWISSLQSTRGFSPCSEKGDPDFQVKLEKGKRSDEALFQQAKFSALRRATIRAIDPYGASHRMVSKANPGIKDRSASFAFEPFRARKRKLFAVEQGLPSDPMVFMQWHLHGGMYNTLLGEPTDQGRLLHLNVYPVWESEGVDGDQAIIAVVDDGVNFAHSDVSDKFVRALSIDMAGSAYTGTSNQEQTAREQVRQHTRYGIPLISQTHGTSLASIAAGSPDDGTCGVGVAPGAKLSSIRVIKETVDGERHQLLTEIQQALSLSYRCIREDVDELLDGSNLGSYNPSSRLENQIFLLGWGPLAHTNHTPIEPSPLVRASVQVCAEYGRSGKGTIYVAPSGNGRLDMDTIDVDGYTTMRYFLSVGGLSSKGYPTSFAEGGEALVLSAPSGDKVRTISTAVTQGSFYATRMQEFDREDSDVDADGVGGLAKSGLSTTGCTGSFKGTSASAAMVAGLAALMVDANPSLTWKDVMDILIRSCDKPHYDEYAPFVQLYREHLILSLDEIASQEGKLTRLRTEQDDSFYGGSEVPTLTLAEQRGHYLLEETRRNMYIFYDPVDSERMEWSPNKETQLHHSYYLGFGVPNAQRAVRASKRITPSTSIRNDYVIETRNLVKNRVAHYIDAQDKDEYLSKLKAGEFYIDNDRINQNEIAVWNVLLDPTTHRARRIYDARNDKTQSFEDFTIEQVQVYVNASLPRGTSMAQLAICGRQNVCSLPLRGVSYDASSPSLQELSYTFKTIKHWGQKNPYSEDWFVMMRNVYPQRSPSILVHEIVLRIYGHYV